MTMSALQDGQHMVASRVKRVFDVTFAMFFLILFSPIIVALALGVLISTGGTPILTVVRLGQGGKPFRMYRFRTMRVNASSQPIVSAAINKDSRITRFGRILRKTSLDEVPQFFNVLIGDMSVVGPRAAVVLEAAHYSESERRRLLVKPGVTGLWQIARRPGLGSKEMISEDLKYIENWSFWLDIKIVWLSAIKGFSGKSSY